MSCVPFLLPGDGLASIAAVARQLELKSLTVRDLVTGKSFLIEF